MLVISLLHSCGSSSRIWSCSALHQPLSFLLDSVQSLQPGLDPPQISGPLSSSGLLPLRCQSLPQLSEPLSFLLSWHRISRRSHPLKLWRFFGFWLLALLHLLLQKLAWLWVSLQVPLWKPRHRSSWFSWVCLPERCHRGGMEGGRRKRKSRGMNRSRKLVYRCPLQQHKGLRDQINIDCS